MILLKFFVLSMRCKAAPGCLDSFVHGSEIK